MATDGKRDELSSKQRQAIAALLSSKDVKTAAELAKVGARTLYRWLDDAAFRAALLAAEGDAIDQAARRLIGLQDGAIDTLSDVLGDKTAGAVVRLRAAQAVLDYLLKLRELRNTEQRIADLEAAVYGKPK